MRDDYGPVAEALRRLGGTVEAAGKTGIPHRRLLDLLGGFKPEPHKAAAIAAATNQPDLLQQWTKWNRLRHSQKPTIKPPD
jgi:hypothetical protein